MPETGAWEKGKPTGVFPAWGGNTVTDGIGSYLRKHTEALVKDVGIVASAAAPGERHRK
jgi:hypothetical protein